MRCTRSSSSSTSKPISTSKRVLRSTTSAVPDRVRVQEVDGITKGDLKIKPTTSNRPVLKAGRSSRSTRSTTILADPPVLDADVHDGKMEVEVPTTTAVKRKVKDTNKKCRSVDLSFALVSEMGANQLKKPTQHSEEDCSGQQLTSTIKAKTINKVSQELKLKTYGNAKKGEGRKNRTTTNSTGLLTTKWTKHPEPENRKDAEVARTVAAVVKAMVSIVSNADGNKISGLSIEQIEARLDQKIKVNDAQVQRLIRGYSSNCREADTLALDFVCDEIHHPVFTCFRELMNKTDFTAIVAPKHKRVFGSFEYAIVCLGMIDCIAMSLHNPLYQETYNSPWNRNVSSRVQKILLELKPSLTMWGTSEKTVEHKRYATVLNYLRRLVPYFKPIDFDTSYELILSAIENDVTRFTTRQQLAFKAVSQIDIVMPIRKITKSGSMSSSTSIASSSSSASAEVHKICISKSIFDLARTSSEISSLDDENRQDYSASSVSNSPSPKKKSTFVLTCSNNSNNVKPENSTKVVYDIVILDDQDEPVSKKPKLNSDVNTAAGDQLTAKNTASENESEEKSKTNAFTLLMNRSRQLAQEDKVRKATVAERKAKLNNARLSR